MEIQEASHLEMEKKKIDLGLEMNVWGGRESKIKSKETLGTCGVEAEGIAPA